MTDGKGQGEGGEGTVGPLPDSGDRDREILALLRAMDRRLERLERTVDRLPGLSADPSSGHGPGRLEAEPVRREPSLGRLYREDREGLHAEPVERPDDREGGRAEPAWPGREAGEPAARGGTASTEAAVGDQGETERRAEAAETADTAAAGVLAPGRELPPPPQFEKERGGARGVIAFLIAIALLAGGIYWVSQNLDWRESLPDDWLGGEEGAETGAAPAEEAGAAGEESAAAPADAAPEDTADAAEAAEADGEEAAAGGEDAGVPEMPAVPRPQVEVVELGEALTPLPEDASPRVLELAQQARAGDAQAQHDLATLYAVGEEVPQDYERAAFWFDLAADAGVTNAVYNLGVLTQRGAGVERDEDAAFRLFQRAASDGHAQAQYALGLAYAFGRGVEPDMQEAASWLQAASANGFPRGAYQLGRLYEEGFDGEPDLAAAAGWYRIAAEAGEADAQSALERLTDAGTEPASRQELTSAVPVPDSTPEPVAPGGDGAAEDAGGLSREQLRELQRRLSALGYEPGPVDGVMGGQTGQAITAFQRDRGLEPDGEPSEALLQRLREAETSG